MGCFRINLNSPLELLFYALSLVQAYRAWQLARQIGGEWSGFKQPPLTHGKMQLVEQAAFYIAIPPAVLVHEYFHAIPIWLFGGRIINCGYGFYWGFVQPDRFFAPPQQFIISLGGTIGSLLFALILYGLLFRNQSQTLRYFAKQSLRSLLYFSLIYYPVFTAVTFIGDWRTIYNFRATPVLSGVTAVSHILILLLFWQVRKRGWFEMVGHNSSEEAQKFAQLEANWQHNPQDSKLAVTYAQALREGGAAQKATAVLKKLVAQNPNLAEAYFQLALLQTKGKQNLAVRNMEKALELGFEHPRQELFARQLLGQYLLDIGKNKAALSHLSQALSFIEANPDVEANLLNKARLHHLRSLVYRQVGQMILAHQDAQRALNLAQETADQKAIDHYQKVLERLEQAQNSP